MLLPTEVKFMRGIFCGNKMAEETVALGRGHRGFESDRIVNFTSTPGTIAKGEYMVRTLLLKNDQPVQKALGGIATAGEEASERGNRHFKVKKSSPEASTNIAMKGYILPASM